MNLKKIKYAVLSAVMIFSFTVNALVSGAYYLPDVTKEMSSPSYWTDDAEVFMSYEEIKEHKIIYRDEYRTEYRASVDPKTVCRNTGAYDKYGNWVFENDIVKIGKYEYLSNVIFSLQIKRGIIFIIKEKKKK